MDFIFSHHFDMKTGRGSLRLSLWV